MVLCDILHACMYIRCAPSVPGPRLHVHSSHPGMRPHIFELPHVPTRCYRCWWVACMYVCMYVSLSVCMYVCHIFELPHVRTRWYRCWRVTYLCIYICMYVTSLSCHRCCRCLHGLCACMYKCMYGKSLSCHTSGHALVLLLLMSELPHVRTQCFCCWSVACMFVFMHVCVHTASDTP